MAHKPEPRQAAQLLLLMIHSKGEELGKPVSRYRLSEPSLLRVCLRHRMDPGFLAEVQEWLLTAGWVLFFAGDSYAMIKAQSVVGWTRLASKRISDQLEEVKKGSFDFSKLEILFADALKDDDESPKTNDE